MPLIHIQTLPGLISHSFFFANACSIYYYDMYNKTDRKVKRTIVKDYCTFSVSITDLQVDTKEVFGWKHVHRVRKTPSL